jgi:hypothetical protein
MEIGFHATCEGDAESDLPELNARGALSDMRKNQRI